MKYTKEQIEAKAQEHNIDLSLPYAKKYVVTLLKSSEPTPYRENEPIDASGYTQE